MPSIRRRVTTSTQNAVATEQFRMIDRTSLLNVWAAGVTATDDIAVSVGNMQILAPSDINIEISADVIDRSRDQLVFNEVVPPGELIVPVNVTTECQVLITWTPVGG